MSNELVELSRSTGRDRSPEPARDDATVRRAQAAAAPEPTRDHGVTGGALLIVTEVCGEGLGGAGAVPALQLPGQQLYIISLEPFNIRME